ncbi:MAG TPA: hypothetical protein VJA21_18765 [Verrucomicrobiae bacterium]
MKTCALAASLAAVGQLILPNESSGALYYGMNLPESDAGAVSGGILSLTDNGSSISGVFTRGNGSFANNLVIFIDSNPNPAVGFNNTSSFYDSGAGFRASISGYNGSARSTFQFVNGFHADYAISLGVNDLASGGELFRLVGGSGNTFEDLGSVHLGPATDVNSRNQNGGPYTFSFNWSDIGLTPNSGSGFRFETGYVYPTGNSYFQSFEQITGASGWNNTITFTEADQFLQVVPEPTNVALAIFGGLVLAGCAAGRARSCLVGRKGG